MNKKIQIILSAIIIIILFGIQVSYAISTNQKVNFFEVSTTEIASGETLEMTFNLDKVEYDNFKIILNSNIDTGEIYTDENITIEEDSDAIVIDVDKTKLNLSKIKLCYAVTKDMDVNTTIQLKAQVKIEEDAETQDDEGNTVTQKQEKVVLEESQNVTIAPEKENIEKDNIQKNNDNEQKNDTQKDTDPKKNKGTDSTKTSEEQKENSQNQKEQNTGTMSTPLNLNENMQQKSSQNLSNTNAKSGNTNMSSSGMQNSAQSNEKTETATYNGSNNNYLKKIKVKGLELNTTFNKENTTYFVNVTDTSSLKITATAEDDSAKVVVTGNESISKGINKILIAVIAENGDVRYYRIFVNCDTSTTSLEQKSTETLSSTSEVKSALIENVELHATYYLEEAYVEENSYVAKGENILKYTNGTYLTAPYDCYIVELNVPDEEEKCLNSHYVQIQSKNILTVSMKIDETKINKVKVGDEAQITISAIDKTYTGYITHIGSTASNGKFTIDIEFENDGNVKLGMTSTILLQI